ncbi:MAG: hypothetical protein ABIJ05_00095 [Patescibacteria group bacterium]
MKKIAGFLKNYWPVFLLLAFEIVLFKVNYTPNTWLTGWDSTQPELNVKANFFKEINAVWQEYRGLGFTDAMAHSANLIHLLYVYILSLFLPNNLIRYVFTFLMHFLGGAGVYFLVKKLIKDNKIISQFIALVGAFFYLLNPATIQMFYTPLEAFSIHYGFLPWLILVFINYLEFGKKKDLLVLFLVNLLALSQAHVPTVFIVYLLVLIFISLYFLLKNFKSNFKRIIISFFTLFTINTFWGLPYIYSSFVSPKEIVSSKVNILSNPEVILMNEGFGNLKDTILFRGFSLTFGDWNNNWEFKYQLEPWRNHLFSQPVEILGYVLFGLTSWGIVYSLFSKKFEFLPFIGIYLFSFINLGSKIPYIEEIRDFLITKIPYYEVIFRFSFTKFSIIFVLISGIFLTLGLSSLKKLAKSVLTLLLAFSVIASLFYISLPIIKGNFFYDQLKVNIPEEYFQVFNFFDNENEGRIMLLPQPSFWNWEFNTWGYRGSGIIWQGIKNPVMHRAFDPWNSYSETYYWELNYAINQNDQVLFQKILDKYQISWILLDKNIFEPGSWGEDYFSKNAEGFISGIEDIREVKRFENISVFDVEGQSTVQYIFSPRTYKLVDVDLTYSKLDPIYLTEGNYILDKEGDSYPFVNFDKRKMPEVAIKNNEIVISSKKLFFSSKKDIYIPDVIDSDFSLISINDEKKISVGFNKDQLIDLTHYFAEDSKDAKNCSVLKEGTVSKNLKDNKLIYAASNGGVACDYYGSYPDLSYKQGYLLRLKGENREGRSLKFYLQNWGTQRMDLEELLPSGNFDEFFFIPSSDIAGSGYTLNLETRSFRNNISENVIEKIELYPTDTDLLRSIKLVSEIGNAFNSNLEIKDINKFGTSNYFVNYENEGLLVLSQGYDKGWNAYMLSEGHDGMIAKFLPFIYSKPLKHLKVNSWANGWVVPEGNTISIVFWPQYLEWGGMFLGSVTLFVVIIFSFKKSKKSSN